MDEETSGSLSPLSARSSLSNRLPAGVALRRSGGWRALKPLVELELWGQAVSMTARRAAARGRPLAGH